MSRRTILKCVEDPGILELAEGLKVLSDPNRLRILCLLLRGERCVCEVERELGISQQLASHHLNVLKEAGFLASRRVGTSFYYTVVAGRLEGIMEVMRRYLGREGGGREEASRYCCGSETSAGAGRSGEDEARPRAAVSRAGVKTRGGGGR
ncbi:MAG: helix-turn-helix transcriptional regulator [Actinobacteria bacterium]|nr:helix-turn-helix transcriptional regulator [Actinomycetota bacterium]